MISRFRAQVATALVLVVFAAGILISGESPRLIWLRFYSAAVLVVLAAFAAWEHFLWRVPFAQRYLRTPVDLRGTWKGSLQSSWQGQETHPSSERTAFLVVRQSASKVSAVLLTDESRSVSSLAALRTDGVTTSLDYLYLNRPALKVESRSHMHHGAASLDVTGRPAERLHGRYWTERDTRGELQFAVRVSQAVDDYREAERQFANPS